MISDRPAVQVTDPYLLRLLEQLDAVVIDAHELADGLGRDPINWQPGPGRWSIAQCLDHLTRTVQLYPAEIERMFDEARARSAAGMRPYREGLLSRWIVSGMEPPPKMRVRTIRRVDPPGDHDPQTVLESFDAAYARLRALIVAAQGVPLGHGRMRSPFTRIVRFTLGQVLALNIAHARRHLWQARQVRQQSGFPSPSTPDSTAERPH